MKIRFWLAYAFAAIVLSLLIAYFPKELIIPSDKERGVVSMFDFSEGEKGFDSTSITTSPDSKRHTTSFDGGSLSLEQGLPVLSEGKSGSDDTLLVVQRVGDTAFLLKVDGPRKLATVKKNIGLNLVSFRYWYLQTTYNFVDTVNISFSILPNGFVEGVAIDLDNTLSNSAKVQLVNQIEQFQFYQIDVAETTLVQYPLRFLSGKAVY